MMSSEAEIELNDQNKKYKIEVERAFSRLYPALSSPLEEFVDWIILSKPTEIEFRARIHALVQVLGTLVGRMQSGLDVLKIPEDSVESLYDDSITIGREIPLVKED